MDSNIGATAYFGHFVIAEIIQGMEQKPLPLLLGTKGQYRHNLVQRFPLANHILRGGTVVGQAALGGNYVLVIAAPVPMPPLFMGKVLRLTVSPVKVFIDLGADLNGHQPSVIVDGYLYRFSSVQIFAGSERRGRGTAPGPVSLARK